MPGHFLPDALQLFVKEGLRHLPGIFHRLFVEQEHGTEFGFLIADAGFGKGYALVEAGKDLLVLVGFGDFHFGQGRRDRFFLSSKFCSFLADDFPLDQWQSLSMVTR